MRIVRATGTVVITAWCALLLNSCKDKGTEPPPDPVTADRTSVSLSPGESTTIQISGGDPPYSITVPPDPRVATAVLQDSTISPATLVISAPVSATDDDVTTLTVGDVDESRGGEASQRTSHGDNSVEITVTIVPVGSVSYADDIQPIWDSNCKNRGCHPGGGAPFSLDRFVSWGNLYFVPASNMSCGAVYRVAAGSPDSSLLYLLVTGRSSCPRMPFSLIPGDTLSLVDQIKIKDWIEQGANNN